MAAKPAGWRRRSSQRFLDDVAAGRCRLRDRSKCQPFWLAQSVVGSAATPSYSVSVTCDPNVALPWVIDIWVM